MRQNVDLIGFNGNVYTVDSVFSIVEAFAVKDGKFIDIGSTNYILSKYNTPNKGNKIDFNGDAVYPGFQDSHCHLFGLGSMLGYVNLRGLTSYESILDSLSNYYKNNPNVNFIIGDGWDQNLWEIKRFPSNKELNSMFQHIPVVLTRIDYHASIANQAAINKANISENEFGRKYDKSWAKLENGKFTGLFFENICEYIKNEVAQYNIDDISKALLMAQEECFKYGLTSVCTEEDINTIRVMDSLVNNGEFMLKSDIWLSCTDQGLKTMNKPYHNKNLKVETLKLYADGALGSRGATLLEPYSDDKTNLGIEVTSADEFKQMCQWAYDNGFKVATHAIGDSANRRTLDIYGEFYKYNKTKEPYRSLNWRIEHSQIVNKEDISKFKEYEIIPSVQPTHCTSDMLWAGERLGDRLKDAYIYKSLLQQNGWLPTGTDFPIEEVNPINTFYAAVYRKNNNFVPEDGFQMSEALSKEDALRSMTIWGAKATQEENKKGSIEKGKDADFIILSCDIMQVNEKEILGANVNSTYLNGKLVWNK